jgi:N6-L-threonylcarbamoyladenine synthase
MNETPLDQQQRSDICASFQMAVVDVLVAKAIAAANALGIKDITLAGGVSANSLLRRKMAEEAQQHRCQVFYPPLEYCMDNGAMIGYVGWMKLKRGDRSDFESTAVANLSL